MALYSPGIVYYDAVPPLQFTGSADVRRNFIRWFDEYDGRSVWIRSTVCCLRSNGKWLITHEHISMPGTWPDPEENRPTELPAKTPGPHSAGGKVEKMARFDASQGPRVVHPGDGLYVDLGGCGARLMITGEESRGGRAAQAPLTSPIGG